MGYRHRFAAVSKTLVDETANHTIDELRQWCDARGKDTEDGVFFYDIYDQKEIFDFGKDCRFAEELIAKSQPVYHNNDTQEYMDVPVIVNKEGFLFVLDQIRLIVKNHYQECMEMDADCMKAEFKKKADAWSLAVEQIPCLQTMNPKMQDSMNRAYYPYNIDDDREHIVNSWLYEYSVFELVRLYKTFDWDNNYLLFYGW
jgi:hypothetical protein